MYMGNLPPSRNKTLPVNPIIPKKNVTDEKNKTEDNFLPVNKKTIIYHD